MAPPDWKNYDPDPSPADEPRETIQRYTPPSARAGRGRGVVLLAVAGAVAVVGVGVAVAARSLAGPDDPQTAEGFAALLEDLADETGGTTVLSAVIYPGYAIVDVAVAEGDERVISYRWDGGLDEWNKTTNDDPSFDLAGADSSQFERMCEEVLATVDDPGKCYLSIRRPDDDDETPGWISAYTSNEFGQSSYIEYDLDGAEVERHTP
ncbi:hypothetical protein [Nocardioides humi]|uniref:DUF5590 domain-containing protein n=1 Tax=Nocardioides humi TaxID=449461 RepID=A0ABN2B7V9_9ACTN|nr:hypothetical protein [Nocardioides humi]